MPAKIKDIARKLGVSPATVSMVINNRQGISDSTRRRVLRALEESGYTPSGIKAKVSKQGTVSLLVYRKHSHVLSDTPFFSQLIEGIEFRVKSQGYKFTVSYYDSHNIEDFVNSVRSQSGAQNGILLLGTEMSSEDLSVFRGVSMPLVLLDCHMIDQPVNEVLIDNQQGAFQATTHLIKCGHKKIGYLHSRFSINNFSEREEGYRKALGLAGIPADDQYTVLLDSTIDGAYNNMKEYLEQSPSLPTAYFSDNDIIAFGAMKALKEYGVLIPDEVSIVGFDDMPFDTICDPPLSTVKVMKKEMGEIAADRLMRLIENEIKYVTKTRIGTELVLRSSVKTLFEE